MQSAYATSDSCYGSRLRGQRAALSRSMRQAQGGAEKYGPLRGNGARGGNCAENAPFQLCPTGSNGMYSPTRSRKADAHHSTALCPIIQESRHRNVCIRQAFDSVSVADMSMTHAVLLRPHGLRLSGGCLTLPNLWLRRGPDKTLCEPTRRTALL